MRVGLSARVLISDSHPVEGCCRRRAALGSNADRELQEGPGSSGVRRLTERLEPRGVAHAAPPRDTDAWCWQTMPCTPCSRGCRPPSRTAPTGPRLIGTALSCPAVLCVCSSRASWPRLRLATRHGRRVCSMARASSRHDGTAWTNRSARAMMTAVRHDAMLPLRVSAEVPGGAVDRAPETAVFPHPLDRRRTMSEIGCPLRTWADTRRMFGGGTITSAGSAPGAWDVAPISSGYSAKRSSAPSGAVTPSARYSAK